MVVKRISLILSLVLVGLLNISFANTSNFKNLFKNGIYFDYVESGKTEDYLNLEETKIYGFNSNKELELYGSIPFENLDGGVVDLKKKIIYAFNFHSVYILEKDNDKITLNKIRKIRDSHIKSIALSPNNKILFVQTWDDNFTEYNTRTKKVTRYDDDYVLPGTPKSLYIGDRIKDGLFIRRNIKYVYGDFSRKKIRVLYRFDKDNNFLKPLRLKRYLQFNETLGNIQTLRFGKNRVVIIRAEDNAGVRVNKRANLINLKNGRVRKYTLKKK